MSEEAGKEIAALKADAKAIGKAAVNLKDWFAQLDPEDEVLLGIAAFCAAAAIAPFAGAAAMAALELIESYGWTIGLAIGFRAAMDFEHAAHKAAHATSEAELDDAAHQFAHTLVALGEAFLPWLLLKIPRAAIAVARSAQGAEKVAGAAEEALNLKVSKPAESYGSQFLKGKNTAGSLAAAQANAVTKSLSTVEAQYLSKYQELYNEGATQVEADLANGDLVIPKGIPPNTFKGQRIDLYARDGLKDFAAELGHGDDVVKINRRLYLPDGSYRVPDVYFPQSGTILDGTIGAKTALTPQIVDFGVANGNAPIYIVRPENYGGTYLIGP